MDLRIDVTNAVSPPFHRIGEGLLDNRALHSAMALNVEAGIKSHLISEGYVGRVNALGGQSTGFWKSVHDSVASVAEDNEATVSISHRGFRLRLKGGEVVPSTRKAMSVPVDPSAHGLNASEYPEELIFIPAKETAKDTAGYLFLAIERPRKDGKPGTTKDLGKMIYVLRTKTYHEADPGALPTEENLLQAAKDGAADYVDAISEDDGGTDGLNPVGSLT